MAKAPSRLALRSLAILILIDTVGGVAVRNIIGWPAFVAVSVILVAAAGWLLMRDKSFSIRLQHLPKSLTLFLGFATLSMLWSSYRFESLLGNLILLATTVAAVFIAFQLTLKEFLSSLATALRFLLLGSVIFELFVSALLRAPVYIWWVQEPGPQEEPLKLLMWSRNLLFEGGPIQGLFGNSVLLGFTALLGLIIFGWQLTTRSVSVTKGLIWVGLSSILLLLTRSATVTLALIVAAIGLGLAMWARRWANRNRTLVYLSAAAIIAAGIAASTILRDIFLQVLGKNSDLTGRIEIWQKVSTLAEQKLWFGWGWVSYWAPWVAPFKTLDEKNGIQVMHAHNAWLDVWLQLGLIGLLLFALLIISTFWRTWFFAVDHPRRSHNEETGFTAGSLVLWLLLLIILVQSLTESRILVEGGWLLLCVIAILTKLPAGPTPELNPVPNINRMGLEQNH